MTTKPSVLLMIRAMMNDVGSSLKEDALSDLIHLEGGELLDHGFRFLRLSDGFAVFGTVPQDRSKWYGLKGWPCSGKEVAARSIARKYGLETSEPPDGSILPGREPRHHCEFHRSGQTLIVVHPRYLKVLLPARPVVAEETLLEDLSALYKSTEE